MVVRVELTGLEGDVNRGGFHPQEEPGDQLLCCCVRVVIVVCEFVGGHGGDVCDGTVICVGIVKVGWYVVMVEK